MKERRNISSVRKVEILRELLENNKSVSDLAEHYEIHPNLIGRWKKELFEQAVKMFEQKNEKPNRKEEKKMQKLEEKLRKRERLIAELVEENIELKKNENGEI
jgi:transposase-like protein